MKWDNLNRKQQEAVIKYSKDPDGCKDIYCMNCPIGELDEENELFICMLGYEISSFYESNTHTHVNQKCIELIAEKLANTLET